MSVDAAIAAAVAEALRPLNARIARLEARDIAPRDQPRLTVSEASARYHVREDAIRAAIRNETLPAIENPAARGRAARWLLDPAALDAWVAAGRPTI